MAAMRIPSLVATAALVSLLPSIAVAAFSDVSIKHPHAAAITYVQSLRIVNGYSDGTFRPDITVNRAEFTKIIIGSILVMADIEGCSKGDDGPALSDVPKTTWFTDYVCMARKRGIISGNPDGTFRPTARVNSAEAAKIVVKAFKLETGEDKAVWYRPYMQALKSRNVLPEAAQDPNHQLTRGEMAEIIYRMKNPQATIDNTQKKCVVGGCSGQLCQEEGNEGMTTCEFRPEYACYKTASCQRLSDGNCGWYQTAELSACLNDAAQ